MTYKLTTALAAGALFAATAAHAVPMMSFVIDGDTFGQPFSITNSSNAGESMTAFGIDLSGAGDFCFDTVNNGPCNLTGGAVPFSPVSGATVSSFSVTDGMPTLDIMFSSFLSGDTFLFNIDVDPGPGASFTVFGNELIGATAYADFDDGQRLLGVFAAVDGNSDASAFSVTGIVPTPAVPLPAGALLLLSGLGGMAFMRRKTKAA